MGNGPLPTRSGSIPTLPSSRIAQLIKMEEPRRASLNSTSLKVSQPTHFLGAASIRNTSYWIGLFHSRQTFLVEFDNFFQDGMECLANSRNDISFAKTEMEYLIARSRKAIEEYDGGSSAASASGNSATTTPLGSPRASFKCVASVET